MILGDGWKYLGTAGSYTVWRREEDGVHQMTDGRVPENAAGYNNLEALLSLKGLSIRDVQERRLRILVLVHPGSACGSADFNIGKTDARATREAIASDLMSADGPVFVIDGSFSEELDTYPVYSQAIEAALQTARNRGYPAERIMGPDDHDFDQTDAARTLIERHGLAADGSFIALTGAWFDPEDEHGCINSVYDVFAERGFGCDVLDSAARLEDEPAIHFSI